MTENHRSDFWLSFELAFVGGYCDAAGYVIAKTFTGHITGILVLAAISLAGRNWGTLLLRFNEPIPVNCHNTMSLGYVRSMLSPKFFPPGRPAKTEQAVEFNTLLDPLPMLLLQPVIQYDANVGGGSHRAVVFGFRTKVEF